MTVPYNYFVQLEFVTDDTPYYPKRINRVLLTLPVHGQWSVHVQFDVEIGCVSLKIFIIT